MKELIKETQNRLYTYITQHNIKQTRAAREMNISPSTLSQFLSGVYPGDNEEMAKKANQYLEMAAEREKLLWAPAFRPDLKNTDRILTSVRMAHICGYILPVFGPAGCGKSASLRYYASQHNGVIYVEADATMSSLRNILIAILENMGEDHRHMSTAQMMRFMISELKDTGNLLIVDEAQQLTEKTFDMLRGLNDKAGIGLVFAGTPDILRRMFGRLEEKFDPLYSRCGDFCELKNRHTVEDATKLLSDYTLTKDCVQYLCRVSNQKGGLRLMLKQFNKAKTIAKALEQDISIPILEEASRRMNIVRQGGV